MREHASSVRLLFAGLGLAACGALIAARLGAGLDIPRETPTPGDAELKIIEAAIDPPDVHVGDVQRLRIRVEGALPLVLAEARIQLDHEVKVLPLLPEGEGWYAAEWQVYDTHDATYRTVFVAKDKEGKESTATLAWSDACGIPYVGNWNISSNGDCIISSDDGVESGDVVIGGYTLTLANGAGFARNPGYSMTIATGGSIVIGEGSSLVEAYAWTTDDDGDGIRSAETALAANSPGSDWFRRSDLSSAIDCDDEEVVVWRVISGLQVDQDHDGYVKGAASALCVGDIATYNGRTYYAADPHDPTICILGNHYYLRSAEALGQNDANDCDPDVQEEDTG